MDAHSVELLIGRRGGFGSFDLSSFEVEATVTRVLHGSPDTAEIIVKNLDEPTAGSLTAGAYVELQANGVRLFGGDISDVEARWAGGTVDCRITAADGRDAWETAAVAVAKPAGTTLDAVIRALAAQASIPVAYISADVGAVALASPAVYVTRFRHAMDRVCRGRGRWTIQHGALTVLADGDKRGTVAALVIDDETPLTQYPTISGKKISVGLKLETGVVPGQGIEIRLTRARGSGRISNVVHRVGSGGRVWETQIQAKVM